MSYLVAFWYSRMHAEHYRSMNESPSLTEKGKPDIKRINLCRVNGHTQAYTACTRKIDSFEPYEGALERFPDYRKLGVGEMYESATFTRTPWGNPRQSHRYRSSRHKLSLLVPAEFYTAGYGKRWIIYRNQVPVARRKNREMALRRISELYQLEKRRLAKAAL
jgi:hypothetical protein